MKTWIISGLLATSLHLSAAAGDWPQWCGRPDRNMVSDARDLPSQFDVSKGSRTNAAALRNVKWLARLGQAAYGSPVIANGKVFVAGCISGVGNKDTLGALWCFRETDGSLLWRFRSPYIAKLYNRSWGITSTPTVESNRVYLLGHLGEVLCLNADGLSGGNTGPFQDEAALLAADRTVTVNTITPDGQRRVEITPGTPGRLEPTDADIIWRYDMIGGVRCWPFNALNAGILIRGDNLYVATCSVFSRGGGDTADDAIDAWLKSVGRTNYDSPSLIVLDKRTGHLLARDDTGSFNGSFHGAHSSPALGTVAGREMIALGGGDGTCYALDPTIVPGPEGTPGILRTIWKFDCIAPSTYTADTASKRPPKHVEIVATPVFYSNRVYVAVGNDLLESGSAAPQGRLLCIDASQTGDVTRTAKIWSFDDIRSSSSTVAIQDGLVYTADASGNIFCLDADTGKLYWQYKTKPVWGSPLAADGKVYVPTHGRGLLVFAAGKTLKIVGEGTGGLELDGSPAVAGRTLYIVSAHHLYALENRSPLRLTLLAAGAGLALAAGLFALRLLNKRPASAP